MHATILIADDSFTSRLMLSALFSGAYYDVLQADSAEEAFHTARAQGPGIVVVSDRLTGSGAAALCDRLRRDPATADALRIVITDLPDPSRTAQMIDAGADDVIARSCLDDEVLARVRILVDHKAKIHALNLRDGPHRPSPGLAEAQAEFVRSARVSIVSEAITGCADWPDMIRAAYASNAVPMIDLIRPEAMPDDGRDVVMLDSRSLGEDRTLRLVTRLTRGTELRAMQILVAVAPGQHSIGLKALDMGANGLLGLPFNAQEAAARIALLLRRKGEISQLRARLRSGLQSAMTDPLTGLYNRRYALPQLDGYLTEVAQGGAPVAVIMADLDHFKWINDTHGHPAGDAVLTSVAGVMRAVVDQPGIVARMGGEEFLIALPDCDRLAAADLGRALRAAVALHRTVCPDAPDGLQVTTSVGVAVAEAGHLPTGLSASEYTADLLARADRALYRAKRGGRNRVVCDMPVVGTPRRQRISG